MKHTLGARLLPYGMAALAVTAACVLSMTAPVVSSKCHLLVSIGAVMVASSVGGLLPGLFATLVAALADIVLFVPPYRSLAVADPRDAVEVMVFVAIGIAIAATLDALRAARNRADADRAALVVVRDEARRKAEELEAVFEAVPIGLWVTHDADCAHISGNRFANELFRVPAGTNVSMSPPQGGPAPLRFCVGDRELRADELPLQRAVRSGEALFGMDVDLALRDGRRLSMVMNAVPLRDKAGAVRGGIVAGLDVTERKRIEMEREALLGVAERSADRQRQLADGVVRVTTTLSLGQPLDLALSPIADLARELIGAHEAGIGTTMDETLAQTVAAVSLSDEYAAWRGFQDVPDRTGIYAEVCRTNRPMRLAQSQLEGDPRFRDFGKAAGELPPLRGLLAVPLIGRDGKCLGTLRLSDKYDDEFTAEDEWIATQLAQLASVVVENHRLYGQVVDADRAKNEFLAMLGHELRNPFSAATNAVKVAHLDRPRRARALEIASRQLTQLGRLIDDLLDVARVTQGRITLQKESVDVAHLVRCAVETTRTVIEARGHALELTLAPDVGRLDGDPARLEQVVVNLLTNAAKYTPAGGRIDVAVERAGDEVAVRVRDRGIGIAPETLPHVFDLFAQGDRSADRSQGGLGIGLTIVRRLVELHGGRVEARSAGLGTGAEFVVRLPALAAVERESMPAPARERRPGRGPRRILLVEDNADAAESLVLFLETLGHDVLVARDGAAALDAVRRRVPDLALVDIGLPGMDGYEVARHLRARHGSAPMTLVALTGYGTAEDRRRAFEAGFDLHLTKPVDFERLESLIERLVPNDAHADPGPSPACA